MYVNGYKQLDMVENQNFFLTQMEEVKSYMVEFDEDGTIKAKEYLIDCIVRGDEC